MAGRMKRWWVGAALSGCIGGVVLWATGEERESSDGDAGASRPIREEPILTAPSPSGPIPQPVSGRIEAADAMAEAMGQVSFCCFVGHERDGLHARFDPSGREDFEVRDGWLVGYADRTKGEIWILPTDEVAGMYVHWNARNLGDAVLCEAEVLQYATLEVELLLPDGQPFAPLGEHAASNVYGCGLGWEQLDDATWRLDRAEANRVDCVVSASAWTDDPDQPLAGLQRWKRKQMVLGLRPGETRRLTLELDVDGEGSGLYVDGSLLQVARFGVSTLWDTLTESGNPIGVDDEVAMLEDLQASGELTGEALEALDGRRAQREAERQRRQAIREKSEWSQGLLDEQLAATQAMLDAEGEEKARLYQEYLQLQQDHCEQARERLEPDDRTLGLFCREG